MNQIVIENNIELLEKVESLSRWVGDTPSVSYTHLIDLKSLHLSLEAVPEFGSKIKMR